MDSTASLRMTVYASLMAALTAAGAYIAIPIGPVPIVLQNLFIFLSGLLLGPRWGSASVGIYLLAGALGLPVFAGGTGGIGHFAGPTGGYLLGYLPAVFVIGLISRGSKKRVVLDIAAMIAGSAVVYAIGLSWLKILTKMTMSKTMAVGMLPFLPGDALKIAAAVPIAKALRPVIDRGRTTDDRGRAMDDGRRTMDDGRWTTEDRGRRSENQKLRRLEGEKIRGQTAEGGRQKSENQKVRR